MPLPHGEGVALGALVDQSVAAPGMVMSSDLLIRPFQPSFPAGIPPKLNSAGDGEDLAPADRLFLLQLEKQALQYFLDNQLENGLVLDRQRNDGPLHMEGLCSTAATGMGLIALALAAAPPFQLLSVSNAALRIRTALETILHRLAHERGVIPHFLDAASGAVYGVDHYSTIETAWVLAGALWAGRYLQDQQLENLAAQLYGRVDWRYWAHADDPNSSGLLRHGKGSDGRFLVSSWDRLNGETAFMYVLAAGASADRALPADSWKSLRPFYGTVAGQRFNNADLGLFVFQYGLDLLDLPHWRPPGGLDLLAEAKIATLANRQVCLEHAPTFATYRTYWGLSAGDGPGETADIYRCYSPGGPIDGTAQLMATLAAVAHSPAAVLENLRAAQHDLRLRPHGRYGFGNVNVDRSWVARDIVGIDAGAAVLALDNFLMQNRVRTVFSDVPPVRLGMERLGFTALRPVVDAGQAEENLRQAS